MADLVSLGELLVDLTPLPEETYRYHPGGGPANMACMAAKLGVSTAFIGQVGRDHFGGLLKEKLCSEGIDSSCLLQSDDHPTTLAFVHLDEGGERSFSFYRHGGADTALLPDETMKSMILGSKVFFFSSVLLAEGSSRETTYELLDYTKKKAPHVRIAFDPNIRLNLWEKAGELSEQLSRSLSYPKLLKLSEEELAFVTQEAEIQRGVRILQTKYPNLEIILVTRGKEGAALFAGDEEAPIRPYRVESVDTTGAGDGFMGAFLARYIQGGMPRDFESLAEFADFAAAAGALITTSLGGIDSQPYLGQIERLMREQRGL